MTEGAAPPERSPFADLPAELVEEILDQTASAARDLLASFREIGDGRESFRATLEESGLLLDEESLGAPPPPTACAADGAFAIERLLATDLAVAAAIAVEGLAPPSGERHWELPCCGCFVAAEPHVEGTAAVLRATMLGEELRLLADAPHELAMLGATMTLPMACFAAALARAPELPQLRCAREFVDKCPSYLEAYLRVLRSERGSFAALPPQSIRREVGRRLGWPASRDDRGMLAILLEPGELTRPCPIEQPPDRDGGPAWRLDSRRLLPEAAREVDALAAEILPALEALEVFHYKPRAWQPAVRVEISGAAAADPDRLAAVVRGLAHQMEAPAMLEPFPVHLADRAVKALAGALPAFRQATTQRVSESFEGDAGAMFHALHGYRSEAGR